MERQTQQKAQKTPARVSQLHAQSAQSPSAVHQFLDLQRSVGNQAIQRLINSPYIQTKLQVSTPGDPYEQEADRVADTVMRMPDPVATQTQSRASGIQTKPLSSQIAALIHRQVAPQSAEEEEVVATKPILQLAPLAVR